MQTIKRLIMRYTHRWLAWFAALAILIFAFSGLLHPIMTWTGPRQLAFFPPQVTLQANDVAAIPMILEKHQIHSAAMIKIVPAEENILLQITTHNHPVRRYFNLQTSEEILNYDKTQAIYLARYYTGQTETPINNVQLQTEFDHAYPWVNRLLPVYRIEFGTDDALTVYIDTELGALANITNNWKTFIQALFQILHTTHWLENSETARVMIMLLLLLSILAMLITGLSFILFFKKRSKMQAARQWHRMLAYFIALPLFSLAVSGCYHLVHNSYETAQSPARKSSLLTLSKNQFGLNFSAPDRYKDKTYNSLTIIEDAEQHLYYRLGIPQGKPKQMIEHQHRFDGLAMEKPAIYIDALTMQEADFNDRDLALGIAAKQLLLPADKITHTERIHQFTPLYDFRNKRLPVWQIDYATPYNETVFIDPATGMLVDRIDRSDKIESLSFSYLHKWNFLTPFLGRAGRDGIVVLILLLIFCLTGFGIMLLLRATRK